MEKYSTSVAFVTGNEMSRVFLRAVSFEEQVTSSYYPFLRKTTEGSEKPDYI